MTITINDRMLLRVVAGPQAGGRRGVQDPGEADILCETARTALSYKTQTALSYKTQTALSYDLCEGGHKSGQL